MQIGLRTDFFLKLYKIQDMTVMSKMLLVDIKFLDIENGEYNLGAVPNQIIDKFVHQISLRQVLKEMPSSLIYENIQHVNYLVLSYWSDWFIGDIYDEKYVEMFEQRYYNFAKKHYRA